MNSNTAEYHILQHSTNFVHYTGYTTKTDKAWAKSYKPITSVTLHSQVGEDGLTYANFEDAFLPLYDDDALRMREACVPPNTRKWRLDVEADSENWFHTEVSNVVLAAWARYPDIWQASQNRPLSEKTISENVDTTYSVTIGGKRQAMAIGEMKRNLVDADIWRSGDLANSAGQMKLSRELRGYAHKYECPQLFCFDGETLLLLQFRASSAKDIESEHCHIDCWVLPRTSSFCTLRYALYRLLAQGWRRCQSMQAALPTAGGLTAESRQWYSGQPIWRFNGVKSRSHPGGYERSVDAATGAFKWSHVEDPGVMETWGFWGGEEEAEG